MATVSTSFPNLASIDAGAAMVVAPVIKHPHGVAVGNLAGSGVVRVYFQQRFVFSLAQAGDVDKA